MITCPSCNHQNPAGSLQCENCYTPLPAMIGCPNCGASVQTDATFCGQCGFNLQAENPPATVTLEETAVGSVPGMSLEEIPLPEEIPLSESNPEILPETSMSSPIQSPWDAEYEEDMTVGQTQPISENIGAIDVTDVMNPAAEIPATEFINESESPTPGKQTTRPWKLDSPDIDPNFESTPSIDESESEPVVASEPQAEPEAEPIIIHDESPVESPAENTVPARDEPNIPIVGATQLQVQTASLLHLQSNTTIEIPSNLAVVHIGKPNGQIPPDIDVAGFPDSEVVSRLHADIRIEGDAYYVEDVGSSNGTYVNHAPLVRGNRHRLRPGDRVALGKGDLVTFIFQLN